MFLSLNNDKLEKTDKLHGTRTATYSLHPLYTCESICKGCYGMRMCKRLPNVDKRALERYQETIQDDWVDKVSSEAKKLKVTHLRLHTIGDIYSPKYLLKLVELANKIPNVTIYGYSKRVRLVKTWKHTFPPNLIIRLSYGGNEDQYIEPNVDLHCKVFKTKVELDTAGYVDCGEDDLQCIRAGLRLGIVYHGQLKFEKTSFYKNNK